MWCISDFFAACRRGINFKIICQVRFRARWVNTLCAIVLRQMLPWQMNSTLIIVYFSLFCPKIPCFARVSGFRVVYSEITDCGKSEQNPASCYYLLVVKLVVKGKFLLLRVFLFILHQPKYFIPFFLITPLIIF